MAEMAIAAGIGADLQEALDRRSEDGASTALLDAPAFAHPAFWFGEDQARYVLTVRDSDAAAVLALAGVNGVPARRIGTTGGHALTLPAQRPILVTRLSERFENWLPGYMSGGNPQTGV